MAWVKKGHIFQPDGQHWWNQSHAQLPVVERIGNGRLRVYYTSRDEQGRSHTSYFEVAESDPAEMLYVHDAPILPIGEPGCFDDCGVMGTWVLDVGETKYLYYIGWTVRNTVPYHNSIGLAVSRDGGQTFEKFARGPLFSPTPEEPYFTGTACVILDDDGVWKNWYLSCTQWRSVQGRMEPFYHLKYAESDDGVHWRRRGIVAIDYKSPAEGGIVKASVIKEAGVYKMWYAFRNGEDYRNNPANSYRIGYAESANGIDWQRLDEQVGLDVSPSGWDADMLAYPHVIDCASGRYLFYNGNGFGRSGIGYAQWVEDD